MQYIYLHCRIHKCLLWTLAKDGMGQDKNNNCEHLGIPVQCLMTPHGLNVAYLKLCICEIHSAHTAHMNN